MIKHRYWIVLAAALLLAACGRQPATGTTARPVEDLPGGFDGPRIEDNTGTSVTIRFTGGVPIMCNVAYGTDTNYGTLDQMQMMAGAARDHSVTLAGLTPGTTYHYRLTITDEQARLYQSEDLAFTTAAGNEGGTSDPGENIASLKAGAHVVGVSSNWGGQDVDGSFGANKALDGLPNTAWSSNGDGDNAWIEIELAQEYDIGSISFWTRTMSDGTAQIFAFTVTTDAGETHGPFELPDADQPHTFPVEFTARRLRFDAVETNTGNTGAVEIEVYGTPHG